MIAKGRVPVASPVNAEGAATADWNAMVGIAGRISYFKQWYEDGEEFPLWTDRRCLVDLIGTMELVISGVAYRLSHYEKNHVTLRGGKIVDFEGRLRGGM